MAGGSDIKTIFSETEVIGGSRVGISAGNNNHYIAGNNGINRSYLNDGAGGFASGVNITSDPDTTNAIALGDIDGTLGPDVIAGNDGVNKLYLNNGSGGFGAGANITLDSATTQALAVADVDAPAPVDRQGGVHADLTGGVHHVDLVSQQNHRLFLFSQEPGYMQVKRRNPFTSVDHKEDQCGLRYSACDLVFDLVGQVVDIFDTHTAGVDQFDEPRTDINGHRHPVARDTGCGVDD